MHPSLRIILLLLMLPHGAMAQSGFSPAPLRIQAGFEVSDLAGYLARFDTVAPVSAIFLSSQQTYFQAVTETVVNYGPDQRHHYLRVRLINSEPLPRRLLFSLQQHFFDVAEVFVYDSTNSLVSRQGSNWQMPVSERPVPYRLHNFLIELPVRQTLTVILHTKVNPEQRVSKASIQLYDERAFIAHDVVETLIHGILFGVMLLISSFALALLGYTRERLYGFYALYVLSQGAYILNINGFFGQFFTHPGWSGAPTFGTVMLFVSTGFHCLFYFPFLRLSQVAYQWLQWLTNSLVISFFCLAVWVILIPLSSLLRMVGTGVGAAYLLLSMILLAVALRRRQREAYWLLLALMPLLLLLMYYILSGRVLPVYQPLFNSAVISPILMFEIIMLGVGLIIRFNTDRKQSILKLAQVERNATRRIMQAQEDERQQLAADLHDDLGGTLAALQGQLSQQNEAHQTDLQPSLLLTQQAVHDLRLISHHLMPTAFDRKGLRQVIEEAVDLSSRAWPNVQVLFVSFGTEQRLAPEREINTYRILRESLGNALKHAQASRIVVQLIYYDDFLYGSVEDNGIGIAVSPATGSTGIGLKNIQLRVDYLQAKCVTESGKNGTLVTLEVPYRHG